MQNKFLSLAVLVILSIPAFSQESHLYVKGGMNVANITINKDGKYNDANALISFHVGLMGDLPLTKFFSVQPSLLFTGKGAKTSYGSETGTNPTYFKATSNPYYVELPVNFVAKIPFKMDESSFFVGAGPYIAMGVAGKNKSEGKIIGTSFKNESRIKFSNDDPTTTNYEEDAGFGVMKRFDYGLNATAGLQLSSFIISANYGYGLAKLASGANNNDEENKHRVVSLSIGFRL